MDKQNVMIYLNGKDKPSFRCSCRANVFRQDEVDENIYYCNSCDTQYTSTPKTIPNQESESERCTKDN